MYEIQQRTEQDLPTHEDEKGRSLLDGVSDLLSGDKDILWVARVDPTNCEGTEILADDLQHDADGEDSDGGIDSADPEKREEADARDEDGDGLDEMGGTKPRQAPGISEHEREPEKFGQEEKRDCPFERLVPLVVHDKDTLLLLRFRYALDLYFDPQCGGLGGISDEEE